MAGRIEFSKAIKGDSLHHEFPVTKSRIKRQQKFIRRHKARMNMNQHDRPEASKYRAAALGCIAAAHYYLRIYREEKARVKKMNSMGPHRPRPWIYALQYRIRKTGGEQEYLQTLLFYARSYLGNARQFSEHAEDFVLP